HVQAGMDELSRTRATRGRRAGELPSDQTRRNALYVVSQLLRDAARAGRSKPVDLRLVKLRRVARTDTTWRVLGLEEVERLVAVTRASGPISSAFFALALFGGLRHGELVGLRIGDLELARDRAGVSWVHVRRGADG